MVYMNVCLTLVINATRWVITEKFKDKRKTMKAHLGYEEDSHNLKTDSPTCSHEAMCIAMLTASVVSDEKGVWVSPQCFYRIT